MSFLQSFPTGTTGFSGRGSVVFLDVVFVCWVLQDQVYEFGYILCYSAGAVAPDLPVRKLLRPVFWVIIAVFRDFWLLHGVCNLPKF